MTSPKSSRKWRWERTRSRCVAAAACATALIVLGGIYQLDIGSVSWIDFHTYPGLDEVLEHAAMANRTVMLTTISEGWLHMFDLFLERIHKGHNTSYLAHHMVVAAFDKTSYWSCIKHDNVSCFYDRGGNGEPRKRDVGKQPVGFMTQEYLDLVWRKVMVQQQVLKLGYDLLFTDTDVLWFQDPMPLFANVTCLAVSCDFWREESVNSSVNTGVLFARSNDRTKLFYEHWIQARERDREYTDQEAFQAMRPEVDAYTRTVVGVKVDYLDTSAFAGFCESSEDLLSFVSVHSNCCPTYFHKLVSLKELAGDWDWVSTVNQEHKSKMNEHGFTWTPISCPQ